MALKKIQLKRELRKQRRTSIATGAPMPPALPRRLGSVRGADMAGLTKELPRRFTVGSRAQSELRMAGDGSGYYDDDKKDAAKPDRPPLRLMSRESFRRFAGPPKPSDAPAPAPGAPAAPATPAAPETPAPPSPARRGAAPEIPASTDLERRLVDRARVLEAALRSPEALDVDALGLAPLVDVAGAALRAAAAAPVSAPAGFLLVDAALVRAPPAGALEAARDAAAAALARRAVFGALVATQARADDAPRAPAKTRGPEADGDGAVALRDGLLAEVVGDLAPGACAGALLESLAAASKLAERRALDAAWRSTAGPTTLQNSRALGHIEVVLADFWTNRLLSSSSRRTAEELASNRSMTRTLQSG